MTNIHLNHPDSPVIHAIGKRDIRYNIDATTTKCGVTLPTCTFVPTFKPSTCEDCNGLMYCEHCKKEHGCFTCSWCDDEGCTHAQEMFCGDHKCFYSERVEIK